MTALATSTIVALIPAPSGYHVDFDHPARRGMPAGFWITGVGLLLSTSFVAMRMYTKLRIVRDFKLEDWCIAWSFGFSIAVQILLLRSWASKAGAVHIWEESIAKFNYFLVLVTISAALYVPCLLLAKFSLLLFYYRMSRLRWLRILSVFIMVFITLYSVATVLTLIFPCHPIKKAWDVTIVEGSCIDRGAVYMVQAITNIVTDVLLLLLPVPMVWKLQMPTRQKFGLAFIFVIGSLTCVTSVVRLVLLIPTLTATDQPWVIAIPAIWIGIEANLIIICCSLPALRLFLRHFTPRLLGEFSSHGRSRVTGYASNPTNMSGKLQDKMHTRSHSNYGRMEYSETSTDVELQSNFPKVWSECRRGSADGGVITTEVSHLDDPTPPGTSNNDDRRILKSQGIVVTKTFG